VPSALSQSALTGYDLSMILNGRDIFSLHTSTFWDSSENPLQPYKSYFAIVQFNGNPVSLPWATTTLTQTITLPFASQNDFLYALGKSTVSSSMYSQIQFGGKNAISQALYAQVPVTFTVPPSVFPHTGITTSRSPLKH